MQNTSSQSLCTFSEEVGVAGGCGQLMAEGKVSQRADIQPPSSEVYMKLKGSELHVVMLLYLTWLAIYRHQFRAAEKTKNTAQQLDRAPASVYKPRSHQKEYVCSIYRDASILHPHPSSRFWIFEDT
jgi:hypothetical protein